MYLALVERQCKAGIFLSLEHTPFRWIAFLLHVREDAFRVVIDTVRTGWHLSIAFDLFLPAHIASLSFPQSVLQSRIYLTGEYPRNPPPFRVVLVIVRPVVQPKVRPIHIVALFVEQGRRINDRRVWEAVRAADSALELEGIHLAWVNELDSDRLLAPIHASVLCWG